MTANGLNRAITTHWPLWLGLVGQLFLQVMLGAWFFAKQDARIEWQENRIVRLEAKMEIVERERSARDKELAGIGVKLDRVIADVAELLRNRPQFRIDRPPEAR